MSGHVVGVRPGETSELVNTLTALVHEVPATVIQRRHLPAVVNAPEATGGNKSEASATLGIGRTTLYRRLRQLGLDGDESSF